KGTERHESRVEQSEESKRDSSLRRPIGSQERTDSEKSACFARNDGWLVVSEKNGLMIGKNGPKGPLLQRPRQRASQSLPRRPIRPERRTAFICGGSRGRDVGGLLRYRVWGGGVWRVVRLSRRSGVGRRCSRSLPLDF